MPANFSSPESVEEQPAPTGETDSYRPPISVEISQAVLNRTGCVLFSQTPDFCLQSASANIKDLTGLDAAAWCDGEQHFWASIHEADAADLRQQFKRAAQTNTSVSNTFRIRHALNGRVVYVTEQRQPVFNAEGLLQGYEVAWMDVTRQTIAERRLAAAAWKETLAVLTLGMAHDFTNVIAGIHSLSESYLAQMDQNHPFHDGLGLIKKSSLQASQLVRRMISLHVGQTGERNYHNLNEIGRDIMDLVKKILPRRILLHAELSEAQLPVYLDLVEFRQAVINLVLNAADAMPRGGQLTMRTTRYTQMPEAQNVKGTLPLPPCVCLTVQDTGTGIKPRHLATLFDPFFTTKAKGSGLGLYNARLAMEKSQGAISIESTEGAGTSFHLWLPEADFSESAHAEEAAQAKRHSRRSLLVIGRPGEMLDKTAELLRSHNYYVVLAGSSDRLSELLQSSDYQFDGVYILAEPTDATLNTLPAEVRQQNKRVKLILSAAGCNQDDLETQLLADLDLLLSADLSETDSLAKLKSFFDQNN